jgi:hypothetical protein
VETNIGSIKYAFAVNNVETIVHIIVTVIQELKPQRIYVPQYTVTGQMSFTETASSNILYIG